MGNTCVCIGSPAEAYIKNSELEFLGSNETNLDEFLQTKPPKLPNFSLLKRLAKQKLVQIYLKVLKNPENFQVPFEKFTQKLALVESEAVQIIEEEYGDYHIVPVFGQFTIPLLSLYHTNSYLYQGEWDFFTKVPHGSGVSYNLTTQEKYSGHFCLGQRSGLGRVIFPNGDLYEGDFLNDELHGNGTFLHFQGKVYIGEFKKGVKDGFGKEQDRHESCYEGEFVKGRRTGKGKIIWEDGGYYEGEFLNDTMHGLGERLWPGEKRYYGQWIDGKMHGEGNCVWEDGKEYQGMWFKGLENGKGVMKFVNGEVYSGGWKAGKQSGVGNLTYADNRSRSGLWESGKFLSS